jgi:cell wall-associated NlpC family hydrolase
VRVVATAITLFVFVPALAPVSAPIFAEEQVVDEHATDERETDAADIESLLAFSDPARIWGNGVERFIEEAYRQCFRTYIIGGKVMNLRMPFAENHERDQLVEGGWEFLGKGKADPAELWPVIHDTLQTEDFARYGAALGDGKEKVIILDIAGQKWSISQDVFDIARMKAGAYRGLPHQPYILSTGRGIEESDVYNYLYSIAWTGMDCSGFVWHILSYIAKQRGKDLGVLLRRTLGMPRGARASFYAGTAFFGSRSPEITQVEDKIRNLKPADIILFRTAKGAIAHSAIIQSIDRQKGVIRYLQSTDEAPLLERGVHESFIYFDPAKPQVSLKDPSLTWSQKRYAPFPGERSSAFSDDGARYLAFGGGKVVRLKQIAALW